MLLKGSSICLWMASLLLAPNAVVKAQSCGTSVRRPWRSLSCSDQDDYLDAYRQLKASGVWNELVRVHQESGDWGHEVPMFLLWHRWYVWIFEKELQRVSGSCMTVPYWDWERSDGLTHVLERATFGTNNGGGCVRDGVAADWETAENGRCLQRAFDRGYDISRDVEVLNRITNSDEFRRFSRELEGVPHTNLHSWVGGAMRDRWAPDDPLFLLHHSNVDRMFALWQNYHGHDNVDPDDYRSEHYDANLDTPLVIRADRRVNLEAPGRNRPPTIRELLRNRDGILEVQYVEDNLAQMLVQSSDRFSDTINERWNSPGRASGVRCDRRNDRAPQTNDEDDDEEEEEDDDDDEGDEDEDEDDNDNNRECRTRQQTCSRDRICCSQRCREGRCRRRNNIRRATEGNTTATTTYGDREAPEFDSPELKARWFELMALFTPEQPGQIFEALGREDCDSRHPDGKSWNDDGSIAHDGNAKLFECHDVIAHQTTNTTAVPEV